MNQIKKTMTKTVRRSAFPRSNLSSLVRRLGDVPLERILLEPPPGHAVDNDALLLSEREPKQLCEVVENTLVEKAMGANESRIGSDLIFHLKLYLRDNNIGFVTMADGLFHIGKNVRIPDLAFVSWRHFPGGKEDVKKYPILPFAPELVVEVLSNSNTPKEMEKKRTDYLSAGVKLIWEINPIAAKVSVYRGDGSKVVLTSQDELNGEDVLPGLRIPVSEIV